MPIQNYTHPTLQEELEDSHCPDCGTNWDEDYDEDCETCIKEVYNS